MLNSKNPHVKNSAGQKSSETSEGGDDGENGQPLTAEGVHDNHGVVGLVQHVLGVVHNRHLLLAHEKLCGVVVKLMLRVRVGMQIVVIAVVGVVAVTGRVMSD